VKPSPRSPSAALANVLRSRCRSSLPACTRIAHRQPGTRQTTSLRALTHVASRCRHPRTALAKKSHKLAFENGTAFRRASRLHERRPHYPATASATATCHPVPNGTPNVFLEPRNRLPAPQPFARESTLQDRYRLAGSAMRNQQIVSPARSSRGQSMRASKQADVYGRVLCRAEYAVVAGHARLEMKAVSAGRHAGDRHAPRRENWFDLCAAMTGSQRPRSNRAPGPRQEVAPIARRELNLRLHSTSAQQHATAWGTAAHVRLKARTLKGERTRVAWRYRSRSGAV
jgi:hypothetical protein